MLKASKRVTAARKAARTRRANRAAREYYKEWARPANLRIESLLNYLLAKYAPKTINVRWLGDKKLMHGAVYGNLIACRNRMFLVLPEGYARAQWFHPKLWEVLLP